MSVGWTGRIVDVEREPLVPDALGLEGFVWSPFLVSEGFAVSPKLGRDI